jgi:hypothetical protein
VRKDTLRVYIDEEPVGFSMSQETLLGGDIGTMSLNIGSLSLGNHRLRITSPSGEIERFIKAILSDSVSVDSVLWLAFDESAGTTTYDSSNDNDGTFYGEIFSNGRTYGNTVRVNGYSDMGKALSFDDIGDFANISDTANLRPSKQVAMAMWVKFYDVDTEHGVCLAGKALAGHEGELDSYQICHYFSSKKLGGWIANASETDASSAYIFYTWEPVLNKWYHIAYTFDDYANVHKLFIDGLEVLSEFSDGSMGYDTRPFLIASDIDHGEVFRDTFRGEIDEIRVWNRTLNEAELQAEMQSHSPVIRPLASYSFEDTGTNVNDTHIWVKGKYYSALSFDGVNDRVDMGDRFDNLAQGSITWWINFNSNTTPSTQRFWGKNGNYEALWDGSTIKFTMGSTTNTLTCPIKFERDRWYHLALSWNSTSMYFFADGIQKAMGSTAKISDTSDQFHIGEGGSNRGTQNFNGKIDDFYVWDIALNQTEVQKVMQQEDVLRGGTVSIALGELV